MLASEIGSARRIREPDGQSVARPPYDSPGSMNSEFAICEGLAFLTVAYHMLWCGWPIHKKISPTQVKYDDQSAFGLHRSF